jgi:hypothetical protein
MSFLATESHARAAILAGALAAAGTGAYVLPLIVPWHPLILVISAAAGIFLLPNGTTRWIWCALFIVTLLGVLAGALPSAFAAAIVAASALSVSAAPAVALAILVMHTSLAATVQEVVADTIYSARVETAGPALIAMALLSFARLRLSWYTIGAALLSIGAAWIGNSTIRSPPITMILAALPACGLAAFVATQKYPISRMVPPLPLLTALFLALVSWGWSLPRTWNDIYVFLPHAPSAPEAKFFENYLEALGFAGIEARRVERLEDVSLGALILLPWVTSPFTTEAGDPTAMRIGQLARERRWTMIVAGEHTNLGGVAARLEAMTGRKILRRDLTVPPGNTDDSGPLHAADLRAWLHEAILNRGASVRVNSPADKVLLAGDGWWAEPDIGEWLWVGDYVWRSGDRTGRLALAAAADIDGARWVIIGDNSPLLNSQLVADPRPAIRLVEMASLWPAFLKDIFIGALACLLCVHLASPKLRFWPPLIAVGSATALAVAAGPFWTWESTRWRESFVGESSVDERNFNLMLTQYPALVDGRRLVRMKFPVSGSVSLPEGNSVIFTLVDGEAEIGGVKLNACRRIGSLTSTEGPYLMNAQACRVSGSARVLIGTPEGAAAFVVPNVKGETLVVLDIGFLSRKAPNSNALWLLNEVNR